MQDFVLPSSSFQHDLNLYLSPPFQPLFLLLFPPKLASSLSFLLSFMNTHPLFCAPSATPYLLSSLSCTLPLSLFLVLCMNLAPSSSLSICSILSPSQSLFHSSSFPWFYSPLISLLSLLLFLAFFLARVTSLSLSRVSSLSRERSLSSPRSLSRRKFRREERREEKPLSRDFSLSLSWRKFPSEISFSLFPEIIPLPVALSPSLSPLSALSFPIGKSFSLSLSFSFFGALLSLPRSRHLFLLSLPLCFLSSFFPLLLLLSLSRASLSRDGKANLSVSPHEVTARRPLLRTTRITRTILTSSRVWRLAYDSWKRLQPFRLVTDRPRL